MKLTPSHFGCLLLTIIVVHTCVRIELLNASYGCYLPRKDFGSGNRKWRLAAESVVRLGYDRQIAYARQAAFHAAHPDLEVPDETEFRGLPYTEAEQASLDAELRENRLRSALYYWVARMGSLQYLLAPAALLWSLRTAYADRSWLLRVVAVCCSLMSVACIILMFYRGYWSSLGW